MSSAKNLHAKQIQIEIDKIFIQIKSLQDQAIGLKKALEIVEGNQISLDKVQDHSLTEKPMAARNSVKRAIIDVLRIHGDQGISVAEIVKFSSIQRSSVSSLISKMKKDGIVIGDEGKYFINSNILDKSANQVNGQYTTNDLKEITH